MKGTITQQTREKALGGVGGTPEELISTLEPGKGDTKTSSPLSQVTLESAAKGNLTGRGT